MYTEVPIRLGRGKNSVIVHNLVITIDEVKEPIKALGFNVLSLDYLDNHDAEIDDSYRYTDKLKRQTLFLEIQKG